MVSVAQKHRGGIKVDVIHSPPPNNLVETVDGYVPKCKDWVNLSDGGALTDEQITRRIEYSERNKK